MRKLLKEAGWTLLIALGVWMVLTMGLKLLFNLWAPICMILALGYNWSPGRRLATVVLILVGTILHFFAPVGWSGVEMMPRGEGLRDPYLLGFLEVAIIVIVHRDMERFRETLKLKETHAKIRRVRR